MYPRRRGMSGGAATADVDSDGWPDLYVTRIDDTDLLFRNLGNGQFSNFSVQAGLSQLDLQSNGAGFADVDNDGDVDVVVSNRNAPVSMYINVADKMCCYSEKFMLYFITRLPNPLFSPELQAKTTVVDFTVSAALFFNVDQYPLLLQSNFTL